MSSASFSTRSQLCIVIATTKLFLLDSSKGGNQKLSDLKTVFHLHSGGTYAYFDLISTRVGTTRNCFWRRRLLTRTLAHLLQATSAQCSDGRETAGHLSKQHSYCAKHS